VKKIESEKESPEEENEKIKGERGVSKSKSKEPEHKNIKDKKVTQTKAHTSRPFFSLKDYLFFVSYWGRTNPAVLRSKRLN